MATKTKPSSGEDMVFDGDAALQLKKAHDMVERPDKFAELFVIAAKTQTVVRDVIWEQIRIVLKTDVEARDALKGLIKEVEKGDILIFGKKIWGYIWPLLNIALGILIGKWLS